MNLRDMLPSPSVAPTHLRPMDVVRKYGVSERLVRRWVADGVVDVVRVGVSVFITVESLDRLFSAKQRAANIRHGA